MESYKDNKKISYVSNEYEIIKKLGSGSFGEVYLTKIVKDGTLVASKIEEKSNKHSKILDEYKIYKKLEKKKIKDIIPEIYSIYETPKFNVLVMELLGDNLDTLFTKHNKKFEVPFVLRLGYDMINIMEKIHNCGFIHRDIKPNNFMFGLDKKTLYILDFGLSKRFYKNKKHIEYRTNRSLTGTLRFVSLNVHIGIEGARRDDLISIGYMLIYFLNGALPWQGLKKSKSTSHMDLIKEKKLEIGLKKLCDNIPKCFYDYMDYVQNLKFEEKPDYKYLKNLFYNYAMDNNLSFEYSFE